MSAAEASTPVLLQVAAGIATLTLNRPERKNAINAAMHEALRHALTKIETDTSIRVLIITGAGDGFCAGQDLAERAAMLKTGEVDLHASLEQHYNPLMRRLHALPMPIIAAVNGVAAGAGAALALSADLVIAAQSARFQLAFARVGLSLDSGLSWTLPRLVGNARAMAWALTAETVSATEAQACGLIWRSVDDNTLQTTTTQWAQQLANGPQAALRAIKQRLRAGVDDTFTQALDAERDAQGVLGKDADYREAVLAFMAKRAPQFR